MKLSVHTVLFSIILLLSPSISAQDDSAAVSSRQAARLPYEVVVTPNITKGDLRKLLIEVEDDFVARFNELNIDDEYDVLCYRFAPTMSHIRRRICEPNFLIRERADNAGHFAASVAAGNPSYLFSHNEVRQEKNREYIVLQGKFDEFTTTDADLRGKAFVLSELKRRLQTFGQED